MGTAGLEPATLACEASDQLAFIPVNWHSLLIMGESGVFVLSATYAPGHWDDVITVSRLAGKIQILLPGYHGQVRGGRSAIRSW